MLKAHVRSSHVPDPENHPEPVDSPYVAVAAGICDQHAAALFSLAVVLVGDQGRAETAVGDVICAVCTASEPVHTRPPDLRRELARRVYLRCDSRGLTKAAAPCDQQRTAFALVQYGALSYREVADLMGLPAPEVAVLLHASLRGKVNA